MPSRRTTRGWACMTSSRSILQALGKTRQEAAAPPSVERRLADLAMRAKVIRAGDEGADRAVQLRQRQAWRGRRPAPGEMSGQLGQQLAVERAEQAFDLASALWPSDSGIDHLKTERGRNLFKVLAGEVAAVIDVEHVRNAADGPGRISLAPDGWRRARCSARKARQGTPDSRRRRGNGDPPPWSVRGGRTCHSHQG